MSLEIVKTYECDYCFKRWEHRGNGSPKGWVTDQILKLNDRICANKKLDLCEECVNYLFPIIESDRFPQNLPQRNDSQQKRFWNLFGIQWPKYRID